MAKRRKRRSKSTRQQSEYPGWVWMIFGLALGLSVAVAIHVKNREPVVVAKIQPQTPASLKDAMDHNGESVAAAPEPEAKPRFDFYELLPMSNVEIEDEPAVSNPVRAPVAVEKPGTYQLQAGSFSTHADAERRRAELGLHGIESTIVPAMVNSKQYFRVYIGPITDLDQLNITRSRLRAAKIDVLRIRIGE